jgi:hypothetical protein
MIFVSHHQSAEVVQPSEEPLDLPASTVASQCPAILSRAASTINPVRRDQLNALVGELGVELVAVVGEITDQSFRGFLREPLFERAFDKGDFMRVSRRRVRGDRKTSAVCHCHELRTLAPLGFADTSAPFFAATKVASIKHSDKLSLPRLRRSSASASRICLRIPADTHSWNRRWQVWYDGNRGGKSCQRAPERNIHRMPFSICRSSCRGRPLPSSRIGGLGISGSMISHCLSFNSSRRIVPRRYQVIQ